MNTPQFPLHTALLGGLVEREDEGDMTQFNGEWLGTRDHTLLHSDVNPTGPLLWMFCLIHLIVTKT